MLLTISISIVIFLFFAIAVGLGLGANQTVIVIVAFAIAMIILWGRYLIKGKISRHQNLYLNFSAKSGEVKLSDITDAVKEAFGKSYLKRYDENGKVIEASFLVDSPYPEKLGEFKQLVEKYGDSVKVSFVESKSF